MKNRTKMIFKKLNSFMKDVYNGNYKELIENLQLMSDYQAEKIRIYEEHLTELTGKERVELTELDKKRLAQKGKKLNDYILSTIETTWAVSTIRGWYNTLVADKYNSVGENQKKRGRKPISPEIVEKVLYFAERNPSWGYDHIAGTMQYLDYNVSASTVRKILNNHGIVPDPESRKRGNLLQFLDTQQHVTAATDFATVELLTPYGLVRQHLLFFMDIGTREVVFAGMSHAPDSNWTRLKATQMCDPWDGFMIGKKYLIHDRDRLFNKKFDSIFQGFGVTIKRLPPFSPNLNSRLEIFIKFLKHECLNKIIFTTEAQLRYAIKEYLNYYHHYRPNAVYGGGMIKPLPQDEDGEITEVSFLGGLLRGYRRVKQVA